MIHKNKNGTYCISSHQVWLPGVYESEFAARYAFRFNAEQLQALQEQINARYTNSGERVITWGDLKQKGRERRKAK